MAGADIVERHCFDVVRVNSGMQPNESLQSESTGEVDERH
jgi:hypothetical protein